MPYPINTSSSEIKLFYQTYGEKKPKPQDVILLNPDLDQKFAQDVIDDLVNKGLWDESFETQLENNQLYFKVFREDDEMVPVDAIEFENVRMLPNRGLLDLDEPLQNALSQSANWFGSFIPESIKQTAYDFGNSFARWTEDKLTGLSAYSSIPKVEELDEKVWRETVGWAESPIKAFEDKPAKPNTELLGFTKECSAQPTKIDRNDADSYLDSLLNTAWNFASYVYNNPLKTFTLALAASSVANRVHLPKINFENPTLDFTNGISTASNLLTRLAVAKIATNGIHTSTPLNTMIAGMSLWNPVTATTPEFQVNTFTTNNQERPSLASFPDDSFMVAWESFGQDGSGYGIYGQRFNGTTGIKLGAEFRANTYTTNDQSRSSIATLPDNSFIFTWASNGQDGSFEGIYAQRFNGTTGSMIESEFRVNSYTTNGQDDPAIASSPNGNFVVTWSSPQDGSGFGIYGQRFTGTSGVTFLGSEFLVNNHWTGNQIGSDVISLPDSSFVVTWMSQAQDGSSFGVYAKHYDSNGVDLTGLFSVNTYTTSDQGGPRLASLPDGSFMTVWYSSGQDGSGYGVYGQYFNSASAKLGTEFQVNTYTTGDQLTPTIASLLDGTFVTIWNSEDGSGSGIYGQRINVMGAKLGSEFRLNTYTSNIQTNPSVVNLSNDSFVVIWQSNLQDGSGYGIYGRIFTPPHLDNNMLIINQGESLVLTGSAISASALDTLPSVLAITAINVTHGQFEWVNNSSVPVFNFTQQQINNGEIQFVHDGSEFAPSYYVKVNEVVLDTTPALATIIFNKKPVVTLSSGSITFTEKGAATVIDLGLNVTDDSISLSNATVAITNNFASGEDVLGFVDQSGITGVYNNAVGVLTLTGSSSIANYQTSLRNVTYTDISSNPSLLPRTISFTVNDGVLNSNAVTRIINIIPVNDAPMLAGSGSSITFIEKNAAVTIDPGITLTDVDNLNISNATIAITTNFAGVEDVLGFVNQLGVTGNYNSTTGVLSLTGLSSLANYQTALCTVTYLDTSSNPSLLPRTISFTVNDGGLNSNSVTHIINITPVNDAPVLTGTASTLMYIEKNPAVLIDTGILLTDVDNVNLTSATVQFISNVLAEDVLAFTSQGGISGVYNNVTGILTLTGTSSVSNYQSALRSVTYFDSSLNPSDGFRTISFTVSDGQLNSNTVNRSISVLPMNDPPVLAINTLTITGGQSLNLTSTQLYATDPDTPDSSLTFTISAIQFCRFERVSAPGVGITTFTQQDVITNQIRIVATGGIVSAPAYQVSVNDGQHSTTPASANVNFDGGFVPSISVNKLTISQGGVVILTSSQLNAFDSDTSPASLTFTASNIRYGIFSLVSNPTNPRTTFTLQDIINGLIQFTHDGSENAPSYDISVSDGSHTTNTQAAMITYTNINQAPVVLNVIADRLSEKVDQPFSFQVAANTFFDSDTGDQATLVYSSKMQNGNALPTWISFDAANRQFTGKPVTAGQTRISVFAIDPSNAVGVANFTMDVAVIPPQNPIVTTTQDDTLQNALIGAGVSALIGFIAFALKYGIRRASNKKLQTALAAKENEIEKQQHQYDDRVIKPIASHINGNVKIAAFFESVSTAKVNNFIMAVQTLASEMSKEGIRYENLSEDERNIAHRTIVKELKYIAHPIDETCCIALMRCGFFKAEITPQQIEANAEKIAKAINKALNRSQFNAAARLSDPKNTRDLVAQSVELKPITAADATSSKPEVPRVSSILPKLAEERAARLQLETEMAEMKKQMAQQTAQMSLLLSAQAVSPIHTPASAASSDVATSTPPQKPAKPARPVPGV